MSAPTDFKNYGRSREELIVRVGDRHKWVDTALHGGRLGESGLLSRLLSAHSDRALLLEILEDSKK